MELGESADMFVLGMVQRTGGRRAQLRTSSQGVAALLSQVGGNGPSSLQAKAEGHCVEFLRFLMSSS